MSSCQSLPSQESARWRAVGVSVDPGTGSTSHPGPSGSTLDVLDTKDEIREFLTSRRAKITPQQAGLPVFGDTRRVPGLRREEAAMLAGVSVDYYTKMERGNLRGVSEGVLEALARGLHLDEAERAHCSTLLAPPGRCPASPARRPPRAAERAAHHRRDDRRAGPRPERPRRRSRRQPPRARPVLRDGPR